MTYPREAPGGPGPRGSLPPAPPPGRRRDARTLPSRYPPKRPFWKSASRIASRAAAGAGKGASVGAQRLTVFLGGPERTRVIVVLACVLAMASADAATVGAAATSLRSWFHIGNGDIGLLVAVNSIVGAVASVPFGMLADRIRRTWTLAFAIVVWGLAMISSVTVGHSFGKLLVTRLFLGGVTAVAGPVIASLVGDYFPGGERGKIYSYILTGELVGAGIGFALTGDIAALSWQAAFVILALPAFPLAWLVFRLPEPKRGGMSPLAPVSTRPAESSGYGEPTATGSYVPVGPGGADRGNLGNVPAVHDDERNTPEVTDAQRLAMERGIRPDPQLVVRGRNKRMGLISATRYVLAVRTNVALVVSGACAYFFLAGIQTFGVEYVTTVDHVNKALANLLMLVIGAGAAVGVLVAGPLGDSLLRHGRLGGRVLIAAVAASFTVVLFIPALVSSSILTTLPYLIFAAACLSAQNPPIDAARLDIMPSTLWGRAEGIRTFLRTGAQALAPLLFGVLSDNIAGGHASGLRWTFIIMLIPLSASAVFLFRAMRSYPSDVATAGAISATSD